VISFSKCASSSQVASFEAFIPRRMASSVNRE
jgi:hypothetical protein